MWLYSYLVFVIKSNIYRVKLCKFSTFVVHVLSILTLNGFPGRRMKELIIRLKFMTTMIGVFLIFFSTGSRSFGVHIALTGSPIIWIQSCQGIVQDIGIVVLSQSILLSAMGHGKTITFALQFLWFRGCYYMQKLQCTRNTYCSSVVFCSFLAATSVRIWGYL